MLDAFTNGKAPAVPDPLKKAARRLGYLPEALRLVWSASKRWTSAWLVLRILRGVLPTASVYLTKVLVDQVAAAVGGGFSWAALSPVLLPTGLMATILLLQQVLQGVIRWVQTAQSELVQDSIKARIHEKAARVDLEFYDTPAYFDHMSRANGQASSRSLSLLQNMGGLLENMVTLVGIAGLLLPYGLWVPLVLVVSTLPALGVVIRHNRLRYDWWEETTEDRRWANYYDRMLTLRLAAAEVRLFELAGYFKDAYQDLRRNLRESRLRLLRNQAFARLGAGFFGLLATGATMVWMLWRAMRGLASLGDLALFWQAFSRGQGLMRTLLSSVGQLYADTLFLKHLFTFLELQPTVQNPDDPRRAPATLQQSIEVHNVSFRYPGSDTLALKDFSLTVPAGQTVALVGENGAGKSTLVKLLCRFYDPAEGAVTLDGIDLRDLRVEALRRRMTVLFQEPVRYAGTIAENIAIGNSHTERDEHRIRRASRGSGAHEFIERLPKGYETLMGKQFDEGAELSGGQWKRLALSRAFYRQAPIMLLDEPTSSMDSWAENKWFDRFRRLAEGRTAVIVTHRFTTAMRADVIHVLEEGRIVESGTHQELLVQDGHYAASWKEQMQNAEQALA